MGISQCAKNLDPLVTWDDRTQELNLAIEEPVRIDESGPQREEERDRPAGPVLFESLQAEWVEVASQADVILPTVGRRSHVSSVADPGEGAHRHSALHQPPSPLQRSGLKPPHHAPPSERPFPPTH